MVNYYDRLLIMQNGLIFAICYNNFIAGKLAIDPMDKNNKNRPCNCFTISWNENDR